MDDSLRLVARRNGPDGQKRLAIRSHPLRWLAVEAEFLQRVVRPRNERFQGFQ